MNFNRFAGIFITSTIVIWILIFALSPQPKYQTINKVIIPSLPIASELSGNFSNMEPSEIEDSNFTVDIQDNIASAKSTIEEMSMTPDKSVVPQPSWSSFTIAPARVVP